MYILTQIQPRYTYGNDKLLEFFSRMLNIYIFKIVLLCFLKKKCLLYFCIWKLWFLKIPRTITLLLFYCYQTFCNLCWKNNVNQYQVFDNINRKGKITKHIVLRVDSGAQKDVILSFTKYLTVGRVFKKN